jgi:hypothetical protein
MSETENRQPKTPEAQRRSEIGEEMEAEIEERDQARGERERSQREDLNVGGLQTGTYDSPHRVHWGPSYRIKRKAREPNKPSTDPKSGS